MEFDMVKLRDMHEHEHLLPIFYYYLMTAMHMALT